MASVWKSCTCRSNVLGVGARAALGILQKGVLFSANTKQEATGINNALSSPARLHFQKLADKSKAVLFFLVSSGRKPENGSPLKGALIECEGALMQLAGISIPL